MHSLSDCISLINSVFYTKSNKVSTIYYSDLHGVHIQLYV